MTDRANEHPSFVIRIIEARHIAPMDKGGTSDPYCRLKCTFNKQRFKTKVIDKTLTPKWDESFRYFAPTPLEGSITLKMWDKDRWTTDDFLGEVQIDISKYSDGQPHDQWFILEHEPKKKNPEKGEVHLLITYNGNKPAAAPAASNGTASASAAANTGSTSPTSAAAAAAVPPAASDARVRAPSITGSGGAIPTEHNPNEKLEDKYEVGKEIGRGGFSIVRKGKNKANGQFVAIKCINKKTLKKEELQLLSREINIMRKLHHKNIVQLFDLYETSNELFLVLEFVPGGELFDQIVERGSYSEHDAANLVRQIMEGIDYMHRNGVVHRDLKPENLLCASANVIKIADFGLSKDIETGNLQTSCGTPSYVAPEVLMGGQYDSEVDMWSIGVITYVLLCGFTPFYGDNQRQLFERILSAKFDFPSPEWDDISEPAKDFVQRMLVVNPAQRMTAEQALAHQWIQDAAPKRALKSFGSVRDGIRNMKQAQVMK